MIAIQSQHPRRVASSSSKTRLPFTQNDPSGALPIQRRGIGRAVPMAILCLVLMAGCSDPQRQQLIGRWDLQVSSAAALEAPSQTVQDALEENQDFQDRLTEGDGTLEMALVFHGNGKLETMTGFAKGPSHKTGTWTWVEYDDSTKTALVHCTLVNERFPDSPKLETEIVFIGEDLIRLVPPNIATLQQEMLFRRYQDSATKGTSP